MTNEPLLEYTNCINTNSRLSELFLQIQSDMDRTSELSTPRLVHGSDQDVKRLAKVRDELLKLQREYQSKTYMLLSILSDIQLSLRDAIDGTKKED